MSTVFIDFGGCLDQLSPEDAGFVLAIVNEYGWEARVWSAAPGSVPVEWGAIEKDLHLLQPGDMLVDDDPQILLCARRMNARGIPARDLRRLPELLAEQA